MSRRNSAIVCLQISLAVNVLLAAAKLFAGIVGHSRALIADGINSLADIVSATVAWVGHRISLRPPDEGHPDGHGNADVLAALFVALMVFGTGLFVAQDAWLAFTAEEKPQIPSLLPVIVAIGVILIKSALYIYSLRVAKSSRSPAVLAGAIDHKADIWATSGALIGVFAARVGWPMLDPWAAIWVAGMILYHAVRIVIDNVHILMAGQPPPGQLLPIKETLVGIPQIDGLHRTRARTIGTQMIFYAEILVDPKLSVEEAHEIGRRGRRAVLEQHPEVLDVVIHCEPREEHRLESAEYTE